MLDLFHSLCKDSVLLFVLNIVQEENGEDGRSPWRRKDQIEFAMGAAESTQYSNYDIFQKDSSFYSPFQWELHHAKSKADGSLASIFRTSVKSATATNA